MFAAAVLGSIVGYCQPLLAQTAPTMQELFSKQRIIGDFGKWTVMDGQTIEGTRFCYAYSALSSGQGGGVALRTLSTAPGAVEWEVFVYTTPSMDLNARILTLATLSPRFVASASQQTVQTEVSIGSQPPLRIDFKLFQSGATEELRSKYWWLVRDEPPGSFPTIATWVQTTPDMHITFAALPQITVSMVGFSQALDAMRSCR